MKPFKNRLALLLIGLLVTISLSGCVFYSEALSPTGDFSLETKGDSENEKASQTQGGENPLDRDTEAGAKGLVSEAVSKKDEAEQGDAFEHDQGHLLNNEHHPLEESGQSKDRAQSTASSMEMQQEVEDSSPSSQPDRQKEGTGSNEGHGTGSDSHTGQGTKGDNHSNTGQGTRSEANSKTGQGSGKDTESNLESNPEKGASEQQADTDSSTPLAGTDELTVTFTIIGPADIGTILEDTVIDFKEGETVLDTLKRVTRAHKIQMEYRGRKSTAYIEGIHNIYEFDYGAESGWLYSVNGVFPNRGAGVWTVEPNDHIRWLYTVDLGRDWDAFLPELKDED